MIVARQQQYYQTIPEIQQKPNTGPKKPIRRKNVKVIKRKALTRVCVALAVGILVISRFVVISEYNYSIRMLEKELGELRKVNERLQLQHAEVMDINWLEDHALHQLGMIYPESRDIVYVAVESTGEGPLLAETEDTKIKSGLSGDGWFALLAGMVGRVFDMK
ncbi:MAG: hypothetical protein ACOX42_03350 [Clostridia bacterium]|jgi:cell division protein FtsL|nr:hypothetical protein [Clostridiales bacterium]